MAKGSSGSCKGSGSTALPKKVVQNVVKGNTLGPNGKKK